MTHNQLDFDGESPSLKFVYSDGRRSEAPTDLQLDLALDSPIRALTTLLGSSYAQLRKCIELEHSADDLKQEGVPREWTMKYLEYEGFSLRPQPLAHTPLATVIRLLPETHYVFLETSDGNFAALVDGVLYDTDDWSEDQLTYVTNFWQLRSPSKWLSGNLHAQIFDVNGDKVEDFGFNHLDDMIKEPLALAPYAFFTRSLDHAWRPNPAGEFTLKSTYFAKLRSSGEEIAVASDSLPCSPRYLDVFERPAKDHSETAWHHQLSNNLLKDVHRLLSAFDVPYQEMGDDSILIARGLSYAVKSGEVVDRSRRRQKLMGRGYRRLRRSLFRHHTLRP